MTNKIKNIDIPQPKPLDKIIVIPAILPKELAFIEKYYKKNEAGKFELKDYLRLAWDSIIMFTAKKAGYIQEEKKSIWILALEVILEIIRGYFKRGTN